MGLTPCTQRAGLFLAGAEALHLAPATHGQHTLQGVFTRVDDQPAVRRHGAHQVMELTLDGREVVEYVRVVELQVVQNQRARPVVNELAALVEERGVVLVGFDDERRAWAHGTQSRGHAEVQRHAAHQEARLQPGLLQHPRQHGRGGGLAVRAGNRQHMAALKHVFSQPLRATGVGRAGVEHGLHQRVATRHHVADHEQIRLQCQLVGTKTFGQRDAKCTQLVAHRRIDVGIAARDDVAALARQSGQTAHESAADT